jgi:nicotinamidase-related amidase
MTIPAPKRPGPETIGLAVVDIQEKFSTVIPGFDAMVNKAVVLIKAFDILKLPVFITEQYPRGLGPTVKPVRETLPSDCTPLPKKYFSCCGAEGFLPLIEKSERRALALCGIETHVCVYQTALDLIERDFTVLLVVDAVASRNERDHAIALRRMEQAGVHCVSVELLLFDLLRTAEAPLFREVQSLIK